MSSIIARQAVAVCAAALSLVCPSLLSQAFTFGPTHKVPIPGSYTYIVTPLDMNGDGNTDLYISSGEGNLIYLGNGKGSFSSTPVKAVIEPGGVFELSPVFYDVNGDGFADEVYGYSGYTDPSGEDSYQGVFAVLLGNGKGQFTETTYLYVGGDEGVSSLVAGDFNHDGKLDFALVYPGGAGDAYESALTIFLNTGDGKFQASSPLSLTGNPGEFQSLTAGDFNGDGKLDLAWIDSDPKAGTKNQFAVHCLLGNGDGTFRADTICYTLDGRPYSIASADFNRDGKADLIVSTDAKLDASGKAVPGAKPRLITLLAKGGGSFSWSSSVSWDNIATSLQITDLNGDGKPDVIADTAYLFENRGNGVFNAPQTFATGATNTFVPVVRGGLPAVFYLDPVGYDYIDYRLNTSPR